MHSTAAKQITRGAIRTALDLSILTVIAAGLALQAQTPYGFALTDGGGRLTDLGCFALFLGIMAALAALLPLARWVDETGRWEAQSWRLPNS